MPGISAVKACTGTREHVAFLKHGTPKRTQFCVRTRFCGHRSGGKRTRFCVPT